MVFGYNVLNKAVVEMSLEGIMVHALFLLVLLLPSAFLVVQQELLVVIGKGNWVPYEMKIYGKLTGFHVGTVREVAAVMNIKLTIKTVPCVRALKMVKQGGSGCNHTFLAKTEERASYIFYAEKTYSLVSNTI